MEVSDEKSEYCGQELVESVVSLSGLPEMVIRSELDELLDQHGFSHDDLTLGELRVAMLSYLEAINEDIQAQGTMDTRSNEHSWSS